MCFGPQDNPALGLRAHRLFRFHPDILVTQVRAVLRAAAGEHQLRLMYPMVECVDDLQFVRGLVVQAVESLAQEGVSCQRAFQEGVLVETPSAAWSFSWLLREIDFAGIGTNDLIQYLFAVERNAANVADRYRPEHPVVLQILRQLVQQAAAAGKPLHLCGELAADVGMLPVLVGLGIGHFSVAPGALEDVRAALGRLDRTGCEQLAKQCQAADTVAEVHGLRGRAVVGTGATPAIGEGQAVDPICGDGRGQGPDPLRGEP
jgi:phosphoenolpyruvate-protein kinase (PTS system EI component)